MAAIRRVAVVIDLTYPLHHHHGVFAGIQSYARERPHLECKVQPFVTSLRRARGPKGYHGIIARATRELASLAARERIPLVNVWTGSPATGVPSVVSDYAACGRMAAEHLLQRGFRQFAFQGFRQHQGSKRALAAFESVLAAARCRCAVQMISSHCDETSRGWERYMRRLERWIGQWRRPVGVFVPLDTVARYVANACLHLGLRVPEDVALIGLGNEPLICSQPEPSLSSFDQNYERVGYEAAALVERMMAGKPAPRGPIYVEPAQLVVRRSTDVCLVDDPMVATALRFMAEKSHAGIGVEDVARHVLTSVRSLERHFRAATGSTIHHELVRLRLERAKRLLVESDRQIKSVARDCGFTYPSYFHRVFVRSEGMSPGAYRRRRTL